MRPSPKVKTENRRASTISILFPACSVQRYDYLCGMHGCNTSHHACVRLNGQMYVTPVRQKWANQVAELAGKKEVKAGLLHIDFVPSEYNHKVHFTEVNKKKGVSLSWSKDPYGTLEPQLATTLTITASIYYLTSPRWALAQQLAGWTSDMYLQVLPGSALCTNMRMHLYFIFYMP